MRIPLAIAAVLALAVLALDSFGFCGHKVEIGAGNAARELECSALDSLGAMDLESGLAVEDCVN